MKKLFYSALILGAISLFSCQNTQQETKEAAVEIEENVEIEDATEEVEEDAEGEASEETAAE
jgi:hypothetical protein